MAKQIGESVTTRSTNALTPNQVRQARRLVADGKPCKTLADEWGVNDVTLWSAVTGRSWKGIQDPPPVREIRSLHCRQKKAKPAPTCCNCGRECKQPVRGRCQKCYRYWLRHGTERDEWWLGQKGHHLSKEQVAALYRQYAAGKSLEEVAKKAGMSRGTLRLRFEKAGYPIRPRNARYQALTAALVVQARTLVHVEGWRVKDAAKLLRVKYQTLYAAAAGTRWLTAGGPLPGKLDAGREPQPCTRCEMLTSHESGLCRYCRAGV